MTDDKWYNHKGYLLTGLWQHEGNISSLAKETSVAASTLRGAVKRCDLTSEQIKNAYEPEITLHAYLQTLGLSQSDIFDIEPMPQVPVTQDVSPEESRALHESTTRCPLCNDFKLHTMYDYNTQSQDPRERKTFRLSTFNCKTTLDRDGEIIESNRCMSRQIKQAERRGQSLKQYAQEHHLV